MPDKQCSEPGDDVVWVKVLNYFSKFIIPATLITVASGVIYSYGAIQSNTIHVRNVKEDVKRVSTEHNQRIMANLIANEKTAERVSKLEVYLPQILDYVKDNKSDQKENRKNQKEIVKAISSLEKTVAVLIDRSSREKVGN